MGAFSVFTATMASGSNSCTFDTGGAWHYQYLVVPTMTSSANLDIYVPVDGNEVSPQVNYYQMRQQYFTNTSAPSYIVAATAAVNGAIVPLNCGIRYLKFIADSAPANGAVFKLICGHGY